VGVACPEGALTNDHKTLGDACPQGALKHRKKGRGRMSSGCSQTSQKGGGAISSSRKWYIVNGYMAVGN
jgi:hypothetical protein